MANQSAGARTPAVGAVAAGGEPHRRRGLWWLLAAVVVLAIIAGVLIAALSGSSHHTKHISPKGAAPAAAAPGTAAAAAPTTSTAATSSGQGSSAATGGAAGAGLSPAGQVGGDGVAARIATRRLAPAGSIGVILFSEDGTGLDRPAQTVIATAVKEIRARHSTSATVVGYTDSIGNARANRTLSLERARRVLGTLRRQLGSSTAHLTAVARGQAQPVAPNTTAQGRQLDRRVEIFVNG